MKLNSDVVFVVPQTIDKCGGPLLINRHLGQTRVSGEFDEGINRWQTLSQLPGPGQSNQRDLGLGKSTVERIKGRHRTKQVAEEEGAKNSDASRFAGCGQEGHERTGSDIARLAATHPPDSP